MWLTASVLPWGIDVSLKVEQVESRTTCQDAVFDSLIFDDIYTYIHRYRYILLVGGLVEPGLKNLPVRWWVDLANF